MQTLPMGVSAMNKMSTIVNAWMKCIHCVI